VNGSKAFDDTMSHDCNLLGQLVSWMLLIKRVALSVLFAEKALLKLASAVSITSYVPGTPCSHNHQPYSLKEAHKFMNLKELFS